MMTYERSNPQFFIAKIVWIMLLTFAVSAILPVVCMDNVVVAQDDKKDDGAAPAEDAGSGDTTDTSSGETKNKKKKNALQWLFEALGLLYIFVFLILSFILVALFVMNILSARRDNICPQPLIDGFEANLDEKKYQEAYEMAKADESFLGNVLSAGLAKLSTGYPQAIEAMQEVGEEENMKLQHRLSYLALIGTVAPMLGLMGTVQGMIASFDKIASSAVSPKPSELAEGISTALFTTLIGLGIAVPAMVLYSILKNRIQRLVLEIGMVSEGLMSRFAAVGKGGKPAGT